MSTTCRLFESLITDISRISPASRSVTPTPSMSTRPPTPPPPAKEPEPEMELDLSTTPPPVEETLAARRARRQAIIAQFSGIASASLSVTNGASPSPGPSSAAPHPPPSPSLSNLASQNHSTGATPGFMDASAAPSTFLYLFY